VIRAFSYGGGTQSTAALVLAAEGKIDYRTFLFANVGEDSEYPDTLRYVHEYAEPFAALAGIELVELRKQLRDGSPQTLMERIEASEKSIPIPVRMGKDGAPGNRTCTAEFKIRVIEKELRRRGATKEEKAIVGIGISTDEPGRVGAEVDPRTAYQLRHYPLFELGVSRADCQQIILGAGLPVPPRSACYFCPFHTAEEWRRLARRRPELFEKACQLEDKMHARGQALGRGEFFLTRYGTPLRDLFDGNETVLFEDEDPLGLEAGCDSGHCMT
jgi:hypothetical protein